MTRRERYAAFVRYFSQHAPKAATELQYKNPFELLVAVILSAQCRDKRVNEVTPSLFAAFPTPEAMAAASEEMVFPYIRTLSYPNSKARYLTRMAKTVVRDFGGKIPDQLETLQRLDGVGRKTANIILATIYQKPTLGVDTHVMRVSKRLGLVPEATKTPLAIEKTLVKHLPKKYLRVAHHWLVLHGRYICVSRKPKCHVCPLTHFCRYYAQQQAP